MPNANRRVNVNISNDERMNYAELRSMVNNGAIVIDSERAKRILSASSYERQRNILSLRTMEIETLMSSDRFVDGRQIGFAVKDDKVFLVDGYHRLVSLSKLSDAGPFSFNVCVDECFDEDQLAAAYNSFNSKGRTPSSEYRALGLTERFGIKPFMIPYFMAAVPLVETGFTHNWQRVNAHKFWLSAENVADKITDHWLDEVKHIDEAWSRRSSSKSFSKAYGRMKLAPSMAVQMAIMKHDRARAEQFIAGVYTGEMMTRNDPRQKLRDHMNTVQDTRGSEANLVGSWTARAWNAFRTDRRLTALRGSIDGAAVPVDGTPYHISVSS